MSGSIHDHLFFPADGKAISASIAPTLMPMHRLANVLSALKSASVSNVVSATSPTVPGTSSRNAGWKDTGAGTASRNCSNALAPMKSTAAVAPVAKVLPVKGVSVMRTA